MILGEELRRKYALTSLKPKGATLTILAINEALEAAAQVADRENLPVAASHIRCLKWLDKSMAGDEIVGAQRGVQSGDQGLMHWPPKRRLIGPRV